MDRQLQDVPGDALRKSGDRTSKAILDDIEGARALHRRVLNCCAQWAQQVKDREPIDLKQAEQLGVQIAGSVCRSPDTALFVAHVDNDLEFSHFFGAATLMAILARYLGMDQAQIEQAATAGLIHDIGHLMVDQIIVKRAGPLSYRETDSVSEHAKFGDFMLKEAGFEDEAIRHAVRHHHERLDGSGYPDGLGKDELPLLTRMLSVVDAYDAMVRDQAYRRAMRASEVFAMLSNSLRGTFDLELLKSLEESVGSMPAGSLVRLNSGRLALVVSNEASKPTEPVVAAFYDIDKGSTLEPELVDLAESKTEAIESVETPGNWGVDVREHLQNLPIAN